ncbi:MAG: amidohydrolase family protein [Bryobacteraceae bacterium]
MTDFDALIQKHRKRGRGAGTADPVDAVKFNVFGGRVQVFDRGILGISNNGLLTRGSEWAFRAVTDDRGRGIQPVSHISLPPVPRPQSGTIDKSVIMRIHFALIPLLLAATCAHAQSAPVAFTGARVIPIDGPEIPNGVLVVENGKITAVGPAASVAIPADATRIDASGKIIMPGLIDSHSHIGAPEGADSSSPIQPDVRVLDSINVRDATIEKARAGGITTANVMPGSGHLLSGQTLFLKLRPARTIDDLLILLPDGRIAGGMKMANGTNSRRPPPFPGTRAKSVALVREQYIKAQEYRNKIRLAAGDRTKMPPRDLAMEGLVEVLDGKRTVMFHTHRDDDILSVLRLAGEFHFRVVLHHASDAWMVAPEIKAAGVPVSLTVLDSPGGKLEAKDVNMKTAAILERAGILVGFNTDDSITDSRLFLRSAALGVRGGMSREKALYGVTMANARMLDLDSRIGSLAPGKDADFILLSGDPLSVYTHVLETWIDGAKVFDRSVPKDRLFATGGYGASADQAPPFLDDEANR